MQNLDCYDVSGGAKQPYLVPGNQEKEVNETEHCQVLTDEMIITVDLCLFQQPTGLFSKLENLKHQEITEVLGTQRRRSLSLSW